MKKFTIILLLLCLAARWLPLAASAAETTQAAETQPAPETTLPAGTVVQDTEVPFGQVCVQSGCRTIEGMVPLAGSDRLLESSQGAFLYETNTGTVVYAYNPDAQIHPGTLAKLALASVVLESCALDEVVTVTEGIQSYVPMGASIMNLKSLEQLTVESLLYGLIVQNANDAAVALAHHVTKSTNTDLCVQMMNNWAKQAGCTNTNFANVSGLYTAASVTSARDMAKMVMAALENEDFLTFFSARECTIPATEMTAERSYDTLNYMMDDSAIQDFYDTRVTGGMASYHESTGASLVCTASNNGMNFVGVVLGATRVYMSEDDWRVRVYGNFNDMTDMLKMGFNNYKVNRVIYDGMALGQFTVAGGESDAVGIARVNIDSVVPANAYMTNLIMNFSVEGGGLSAPIAEGDLIATVQLVYRSSVMAEAEVFAMSRVKDASDTGVTIHSVSQSGGSSGVLSVLGTVSVLALGAAALYMGLGSFLRARRRAKTRRRRAQRRRSR